MAPTICLAEFPTIESTANEYIHRRPRSRNGNKRRSTSTERNLRSRTSVTSRDDFPRKSEYTNKPEYFLLNKNRKNRKISTNMDEGCKRFVVVRRDLLNIVIRTIILVRRNHILRKRVSALRAETQKFLHSVLNNPKDQSRQRCPQTSQPEGEIASSDRAFTPLSPPLGPDLTGNSHHVVTSTRDIRDYDNGAYSDESDSSQAETDVDV